MKETNMNDKLGNFSPRKFALDPAKLGLMNKINWQKYIKPENTAFIMVDMQKDAIGPEDSSTYKFGATPMWKAIDGLNNTFKLIKAARKHNMKVYWVRAGFYGIGVDIPSNSPQADSLAMLQKEFPGALSRNGWPFEILDELKPIMEPQDIVVEKTGSSAFVGTSLQQYLTLAGIKHIIICGFFTDACIEGTARSGFDWGYHPLIVADACATATWENQYHSLYHLSNIFATITLTNEIISVLEKNSPK